MLAWPLHAEQHMNCRYKTVWAQSTLNSQNNFLNFLIIIIIITSSLQQPSIEFHSPSFQSPTIRACSETVLLGVSSLAAAAGICCSYQCWVGTRFGRLLELWVPVPISENWTGTWSDSWNWVLELEPGSLLFSMNQNRKRNQDLSFLRTGTSLGSFGKK